MFSGAEVVRTIEIRAREAMVRQAAVAVILGILCRNPMIGPVRRNPRKLMTMKR